MTYDIRCGRCEEEEARAVYHGETSKNSYTRGLQHLGDLDGQRETSVMWRHCREKHGGALVDFKMGITGHYRNDTMMRQIAEAVRINRTDDNELINNKSEWNFVAFPRVLVDNSDADAV